MADAAAAAANAAAEASTSAPATPTSTLICLEDGSDLLADAADDGAGADFVVAGDERLLVVDHDEEHVALLLSQESAASGDWGGGGGGGGAPAEHWKKAARFGCVRWIIKTTAMFRFGGKTAYVAVNYLDRFLAQRPLNRANEWALPLLTMACLSLAIKVEEVHAPRLSEFPLDAARYDSESITRMELLVLSTLEWRMIAVTPFSFISCFAARFREDERRGILVRAVDCVFAAIKAMSSVEYRPSTVAVASVLVARGKGETVAGGNLDELKAILGSSCPQLDTEHVYSCYSRMIQMEEDDKSPMHSTSTGAASSAVSVSVGANNGAGTATPAAPDDNHKKRRRLRSPQRQ